MTEKEFETQRALGVIPKNAELSHCSICLMDTPQILIQSVRIPLTPGEYVIKEIYQCLICDKENIRRKAKNNYYF